MTKISDIAKASGYSVTTVSKAFNNYTDISEKTRNKILKIANEMDYIPNAQARGLVMKRSFTIGVILDEILELGLSHPFFSRVIQSFRSRVEASGYSMILISNNIGKCKVESYLSHCQQRNVDGIFILCTDIEEANIQELIQSKFPTVIFDIPKDDMNYVVTDHYNGVYDAINYLVQKGHRKIGHIYGTELTYAGMERQRGFNDASRYHKLNIPEEYKMSGGYFDFKYGRSAMESLMKLDDRPSAVFVSGDLMALGAMEACHDLNIKIPEDVSIIGFDNLRLLDWISPSLTTIGQDYEAIGDACCNILIDYIENKPNGFSSKTVKTHLIERDTCKDIKVIHG